MTGHRAWGLALLLLSISSIAAQATTFTATNLISDDTTKNPAILQDPNLVNAWGLVTTGASPFWVGDNGTGVSTLYNVSATTGAVSINSRVVTVPSFPSGGTGTPTGVTVGAAGAFNGDTFLFVSEDGTVSGWRNAPPLSTTNVAEVLQTGSPDNVYKGDAFATIGGHGYLYAANFKSGAIDVLKGDSGAPNLTGNFTDPGIPSGYAPFNVKIINNSVYVTYALSDGHDDVPGSGHGYVDEFDLQGNFIRRIASAGTLDSPWGLAVAPASFSAFAGDLLVGNFGDGRINVYSIGATPTFLGQLTDPSGNPLVIDGLWALAVGGGQANGGLASSIYFTAGPQDESHGVFGVISAVPEPASLAMFGLGLMCLGMIRLRGRPIPQT